MFIETRRATRSGASNREGKIVKITGNKGGIIHVLGTREATRGIKRGEKRGEIRERINKGGSTRLRGGRGHSKERGEKGI